MGHDVWIIFILLNSFRMNEISLDVSLKINSDYHYQSWLPSLNIDTIKKRKRRKVLQNLKVIFAVIVLRKLTFLTFWWSNVAAEKAGKPGDLSMASTLPDSEIIVYPGIQHRFDIQICLLSPSFLLYFRKKISADEMNTCSQRELVERNEEDFWEMLVIFFNRGRSGARVRI